MNGAAIARAGAKVTLSLRVLNRRPDGYHELDALAAIVDEPHDELSIIPGAHEAELLVEPAGSAPHGEANLLWRTRAALGSTAGLRLRKGIPTEAGLGGGSADAAAALRLLRTTQTDAELHDIAASLGADVPACLEGGLVRMRGIGDIVAPVAVPASPLHLVLATPAFGCSTAEVYRAWDTLGGPHTDDHVEPPPAWARVSGGNVWQNDLEPAAIAVEPRLADFRNAFGALAGTRVTQCGSGSTYYAIAADRARAEQVADAVRAELDTRGVAVATVGTTAS